MTDPDLFPCANVACSCVLPERNMHCSLECGKAGACGPVDAPMARCACGHPECAGWARAIGAG